jgi:hypothetical protein
LRKRLEKVKGTISSTPKKIAHEDQKHQYFLHQISKVDRRKKNRRKKKKIAKEAAAAMANLSSSIGTSIHTSTLQAQHPSPSKLPSPNKKRGASSSYPWNEDPEVITQKLPALLPTTKFKPSQTEEFFPALKNTTKYKTSTALTTTKNNNNTTENTHNTVS